MTHEEIQAYQKERREFIDTPVGAALSKFSNASAAMWKEDNNDNISPGRLLRLDTAYKEAEKNLVREIKALLRSPA